MHFELLCVDTSSYASTHNFPCPCIAKSTQYESIHNGMCRLIHCMCRLIRALCRLIHSFSFCFGPVKQYVSTHKAMCRLILSFFYFNIVLLHTWVSSQHIMKRMEDKQKVSFKDNGYYTLSSKNELLMMLEMKN